MNQRPTGVLVLWAAAALTLAGCAAAPQRSGAPAPAPQPYLRAVESANGSLALEVALRCFAPNRGEGPEIWLVGVTHLGTTNYFAELQQFLDRQSLVLFEGVGATNREFELHPAEGYSLQVALAQALGLRFQLDAIDYRRPHFRNSDLTVAQLSRLVADHASPGAQAETGAATGQSGGGSRELTQLLQVMQGTGLAGAVARIGVGLIGASTHLQAAVKVAMIELLSRLPADLPQLQGLPPGFQRLLKVLIEERDRTVIRDLQSALHRRPRPKSLAVFYGAGHMPDLEQRVTATLGYRYAGERWLQALHVNPAAAGLTEFELNWTRRIVRSQLDSLALPPTEHGSPAR